MFAVQWPKVDQEPTGFCDFLGHWDKGRSPFVFYNSNQVFIVPKFILSLDFNLIGWIYGSRPLNNQPFLIRHLLNFDDNSINPPCYLIFSLPPTSILAYILHPFILLHFALPTPTLYTSFIPCFIDSPFYLISILVYNINPYSYHISIIHLSYSYHIPTIHQSYFYHIPIIHQSYQGVP